MLRRIIRKQVYDAVFATMGKMLQCVLALRARNGDVLVVLVTHVLVGLVLRQRRRWRKRVLVEALDAVVAVVVIRRRDTRLLVGVLRCLVVAAETEIYDLCIRHGCA